MLLFVKKKFADALADGSKTLELRNGKRYAKVAPGREVSINGRFRMLVTDVERIETIESLLDALDGRYKTLGVDEDEFITALTDCYSDLSGPFFLFSVTPSSTIKNEPSEQYSLTF